jgi:hypothetical protein
MYWKSGAARFANTFAETNHLGNPDSLNKDVRIKKQVGQENTRDFTYFMLGGGRFVYASVARVALIKVCAEVGVAFRRNSC